VSRAGNKQRRRLGSTIAAVASAFLLTGVSASSGSTGAIAQPMAIARAAAAVPLPFWERLDKDITSDKAQVPAPSANTSCPDRPNMLATSDTLLSLAELRDKDLQTLREKLDATYAKAAAAGLPSLTDATTLATKAAFEPLIRLMGKSTVTENLGPESDTLSELRLDLSLASRYTARNQALIAQLQHAQTQLESTSSHCD
jgi:hypothetical protein